MSEKTYTLADLEQARKQGAEDERGRATPLIDALELWLDGADCDDWGEEGIDNPIPLTHKPGNKCPVCISKKALADFRSRGPIGETRAETERRVRREIVEAIELRMNNETPDNGDEYSWYQFGLLQGLDESRAIVKSIIAEGK